MTYENEKSKRLFIKFSKKTGSGWDFLGHYSAPTLTATFIQEADHRAWVDGGQLKDAFWSREVDEIGLEKYSAGKNVAGVICGSLIRERPLIQVQCIGTSKQKHHKTLEDKCSYGDIPFILVGLVYVT